MSFIKLLCLFAVLVASSEAVVFLCDYKMVTSPLLGERYACEAVTLNIGSEAILTGTSGTHLEGKSDRDVEFLQVNDQSRISAQIVGRITYFFPNLYAFHWLNGGLISASASDLEPFTKLRSLAIEGNLMTTLQADLLSNTPNLQVVDFRNNQIELVEAGIFDNLNDLESVFLDGNICISMNATTPEELQLLTDALTNQCSSSSETTTEQDTTTEQLPTTPVTLPTTPGDVSSTTTADDSTTVTEDPTTTTGGESSSTPGEDSTTVIGTVTEDASTTVSGEPSTTTTGGESSSTPGEDSTTVIGTVTEDASTTVSGEPSTTTTGGESSSTPGEDSTTVIGTVTEDASTTVSGEPSTTTTGGESSSTTGEDSTTVIGTVTEDASNTVSGETSGESTVLTSESTTAETSSQTGTTDDLNLTDSTDISSAPESPIEGDNGSLISFIYKKILFKA